MSKYYVYLLTNKLNTVFYVGMTCNIYRRMREHKEKDFDNFTKKYNINKLVYFEKYNTALEALHREKQLKRWRSNWKSNLVNEINHEWKDLSKGFNYEDAR